MDITYLSGPTPLAWRPSLLGVLHALQEGNTCELRQRTRRPCEKNFLYNILGPVSVQGMHGLSEHSITGSVLHNAKRLYC